MFQFKKSHKQGFTLIELLVVIAIIGLLATLVSVALSPARVKARDTRRLNDMRQIILALEMFYNKNNRYPGQDPIDNIHGYGECVGDGVSCGSSNNFENLIHEFMPVVPRDPHHNCPDSSAGCGEDYYYYAYDPLHRGCQTSLPIHPVLGFYKFENDDMRDRYQRKDTNEGGNMHLGDAEYNICLEFGE